MVACCVIGCSNRTVRDRGVGFYRFPGKHKYVSEQKNELLRLRRNIWLVRVRRQDLFDDDKRVDMSRVCSEHFVNGQPAALQDIDNVDWAPSKYMGHDYYNTNRRLKRKKRKKYKNKKVESSTESEVEENCNTDDSSKEKDTDSNVTIIYLRTEMS